MKALSSYYAKEFNLGIDFNELEVDAYDIVHHKDEKQLFTIIQLLLGIILKTQNESYIGYILDLSGEEQEAMQTVCEEVMNMTENMPSADAVPKPKSDNPFSDSSSIGHGRNSLVEQQYLDKINEQNIQLETLEMDKRRLRMEISEEKKINGELHAQVERLTLEKDELKSELDTLSKYKKKWEQSMSAIKESESQANYIKQTEREVADLKSKIGKLKKEIAELETQKEEETKHLREEIDNLQFKNIELIKNESLVKMYKKKLDDLKDIKQEKRAVELERDNLK